MTIGEVQALVAGARRDADDVALKASIPIGFPVQLLRRTCGGCQAMHVARASRDDNRLTERQ